MPRPPPSPSSVRVVLAFACSSAFAFGELFLFDVRTLGPIEVHLLLLGLTARDRRFDLGATEVTDHAMSLVRGDVRGARVEHAPVDLDLTPFAVHRHQESSTPGGLHDLARELDGGGIVRELIRQEDGQRPGAIDLTGLPIRTNRLHQRGASRREPIRGHEPLSGLCIATVDVERGRTVVCLCSLLALLRRRLLRVDLRNDGETHRQYEVETPTSHARKSISLGELDPPLGRSLCPT